MALRYHTPADLRSLYFRYDVSIRDDPILDIMDILDVRKLSGSRLLNPVNDEVIEISMVNYDDLPSPDLDIDLAA
jgi:hypothetical protein